ncbi:hypothetical protein G6O67_000375 [Ophiocordyceps sinensis]|uniref:SAP domain-containing protein n=2 Tax=Ophiocordyceps sinensis TaxID=72228 RepID=A0A8H4PZ32_9HYPO|nr:SAP domain protein [Ophiocordyceps sinensis CO18]KAF4513053.1 hypothetical protein G6O67_000375 [Ophiocordyceps sinensis]
MSDWTKCKVTELKAELKRRGLAQAGLKAELIARLDADDEAATTQQQAKSDDQSISQDDEPHEASTDKTVEPHEALIDKTVEPDPDEPRQDAETDELDNTKPPELARDAQDESAEPEPAEPELKPSPVGHEDHAAIPSKEEADTAPKSPSHAAGTPGDARGARDSQGPSDEAHGATISNSAIVEPVVPASAPNGSSMTDSAKEGDAMAYEIAIDALKRKRRSASPTPKEESVKRRRAHETAQDAAKEPEARNSRAQHDQREDASMTDKATLETRAPGIASITATEKALADPEPSLTEVKPSFHPSTPAIYINNLMRPLREIDIQTYLVDLATPSGGVDMDRVIVRFYLDMVRTHAFVVFDSTPTAVRVRNSLHGQVWPKESNRKALFVDFVPEDKVGPWIEMEEERTREKRAGLRWEVVYQPSGDGDDVEALLQPTSIASSSSAAHLTGRATATPTGIEGAPTGPRGYRPSVAQPSRYPRPPPSDPNDPRESRPGQPFAREEPRPSGDGSGEQTVTQPVIYFEAVSVTLARRRLQNMRGLYTRDTTRPLDREINRYSFQDDDRFVDRGREVFEGIRPPHRQQAIDRGMRGGGGRGGGRGGRLPRRGGPAPYRPRGDRYVPGSGGPVDDRGSRYGDDDDRRW